MNTLKDYGLHFQKIYGTANAVNHPGLIDRYMQLLYVFHRLQTAIRKEQRDTACRLLPQLFGWTFACINHFPDLDIDRAMAQKYPAKCGYCGNNPCRCELHSRPDFNPDLSGAIVTRNLADWQEHLYRMYGENNAQRGLGVMVDRLAQELIELGAHAARLEYVDAEPQVAMEKAGEEFADVLSWILSLAAYLGVMLDTLVIRTYGNGCPSCKRPQCNCRRLHSTPAGLSATPNTRVA